MTSHAESSEASSRPIDQLWAKIIDLDLLVHDRDKTIAHCGREVIGLTYLDSAGQLVMEEVDYYADPEDSMLWPRWQLSRTLASATEQEKFTIRDDYSVLHLNRRGLQTVKTEDGIEQMRLRVASMLSKIEVSQKGTQWWIGSRMTENWS